MPTLAPPRPPIVGTPSLEQRHRALAAMRGIAARRRVHGPAHFVCVRCEVAWHGEVAACWTCGGPAGIPYADSDSALQLLLHRARTAHRGSGPYPGHRGRSR